MYHQFCGSASSQVLSLRFPANKQINRQWKKPCSIDRVSGALCVLNPGFRSTELQEGLTGLGKSFKLNLQKRSQKSLWSLLWQAWTDNSSYWFLGVRRECFAVQGSEDVHWLAASLFLWILLFAANHSYSCCTWWNWYRPKSNPPHQTPRSALRPSLRARHCWSSKRKTHTHTHTHGWNDLLGSSAF